MKRVAVNGSFRRRYQSDQTRSPFSVRRSLSPGATESATSKRPSRFLSAPMSVSVSNRGMIPFPSSGEALSGAPNLCNPRAFCDPATPAKPGLRRGCTAYPVPLFLASPCVTSDSMRKCSSARMLTRETRRKGQGPQRASRAPFHLHTVEVVGSIPTAPTNHGILKTPSIG